MSKIPLGADRMRRRIFAGLIPGLLAAGVAGAPAGLAGQSGVYLTTMDAETPGGERVLIRDGFTVPPGTRLLIDDMSVDCVVASEVFDEATFHQVGVEATAILRITYPADACPEEVGSGEGECPAQDYVVGTAAARGVGPLFIQPGPPARRVLRVGAGREMNVFAGEGATLRGVCQGVLVNIINSLITAGSGRLVDPP
jgi:hypothetical protein